MKSFWMIIVNYVFQIIITKMANQLNLEDPSSLSLIMSSSDEEEEVVRGGGPPPQRCLCSPSCLGVKVM